LSLDKAVKTAYFRCARTTPGSKPRC